MSDDSSIDINGQLMEAALSYARRGWPVFRLHDATAGYCSCGQECGGSSGKHPVSAGWRADATTDEQTIRALWMRRPQANVGIATGLRSGVWVLDVDPSKGGAESLTRLETEHGHLPATYTVRTGRSGWHIYFELPDDFTPTNSEGRLKGVYPGIDVRGEGGLVVAAGSVSGFGRYAVERDLPVVAAPEWLLDLIRPVVREHLPYEPQGDAVVSTLPAGQVHRYAEAVMREECLRLASAGPGTRGRTAFEVACNLIELANSPWTGLPLEEAWRFYAAAAQQAMQWGGGFDEREAVQSWGSAVKRIGSQGRAAPSVPQGGALLDWGLQRGVPPFQAPPGIDQNSYPQAAYGPVDNAQSLHTLGKFPGLELAQSVQARTHADHLRSLLVPWEKLEAIEPPRFLIDDWLQANALSWLVGPPGAAKTFTALDMAACIATNRDWHGQRVLVPGPVVYLAAEGAEGMWSRAKAWEKGHNEGRPASGVIFLPMPVQVSDGPGWAALIEVIAELRAVLVVLDTQARVTVGMEENSATDMGQFVEHAERLRRHTGAAVLVVHHETKGGGARGSSAIYGAATSEITVRPGEGNEVKVTNTKQKNRGKTGALVLELVSVGVGVHPIAAARAKEGGMGTFSAPLTEETGAYLRTCTTSASDEFDLAQRTKATPSMAIVVEVMRTVFGPQGGTKAEVWVAIQEGRRLARRSFYTAWNRLIDEGLLASVYVNDLKTARYAYKPFDEESIKSIDG